MPSPLEKRSSNYSQSTNDGLNSTDIPFPELSHHPLNTVHSRHGANKGETSETVSKARNSKNFENEPAREHKQKHQQPTRVTTYV